MANTKFDQNHFVKKIYQIFPIDQIIKNNQFFSILVIKFAKLLFSGQISKLTQKKNSQFERTVKSE
jgi:hypothetical protein